ncbi:MAG: BMP family ABC transporter substrate-binding protein [Oscillospiraceae bacterium]|nr:BMP family ABC transporter substrate-binding protein [Oscillospiraceae bacterium]
MSLDDYRSALRLGQKEYRSCVSHGIYPYLQVLDELLAHEDTMGEEPLGVVSIPLDQVAGTKTVGRRSAFARNFMPLQDEDTEFAAKWTNLCEAHLSEGIRDPIKAYEFMNRFYVVEGNKRVSVLKYFGAVSVPGSVTRILPKRRDSLESKIYYEFLDFYRLTRINYIWFSQTGRFRKLLSALGRASEPWTDEERSDFFYAYTLFDRAFAALGGKKLRITTGDALLTYLELYGYPSLHECREAEIRANLDKSWSEIAVQTDVKPVELFLSPIPAPSKSLLNKLLPSTPGQMKAAFIHEKTEETSGWTYGHEMGRKHLAKAMSSRVETTCYSGVRPDEAREVIETAVQTGHNVIFTTTPKFMAATLKAALDHPEIKLLNCSLYTPHPSIRTYYGRMYEAKFLAGAIAGAMAENDRIGYIADYPIYGMVANINAFALGAKMINPRAKVYLDWSSRSNFRTAPAFQTGDMDMISNQDLLTPGDPARQFGLYHVSQGHTVNIAMTVWNWGKFYEGILRSVLDGAWRKAADTEGPKAINYWWGMSAGVIDVFFSRNLPIGTRRLIELLRESITSGAIQPFSGALYAQDRQVQAEGVMTPEEIIKMDWLAENVIGSIPAAAELTEETKPLIELQGVRRDEEAEK